MRVKLHRHSPCPNVCSMTRYRAMRKRHYTRPCRFRGCYGNAKAHGLCTGHLDQRARGKELTPLKPRRDLCDFPECGRKHYAYGLCRAHREQLRKGQLLVPIGRGRLRDRWVDPKGYVFVKCDPDHPNARSKYGWIAEHVLVMSELLGRPLRPGESVHHRNLLKGDNRPSNLELWTSHQPRGTSVADMLAWCHWFIGQYSEVPEWTALPGGPLSKNGAGWDADQDARIG
jgi:HNH endonuclease